MRKEQKCCWVCGQPATDYFLMSLHDSAVPEVVPVCGDEACEARLRCCAEKQGGLKGHPCLECEAYRQHQCGCTG